MRLSALPDDPGYETWKRFRVSWPILVVYIDGKRIERDIITVDDEAGFVTRYLRDERDQLYLVPSGFGGDTAAAQETIYGSVKIEFRSC